MVYLFLQLLLVPWNIQISDTGKIICQDCWHLTKGGAQYYAKLLRKDINMLLR